jgi:hypothetical protein
MAPCGRIDGPTQAESLKTRLRKSEKRNFSGRRTPQRAPWVDSSSSTITDVVRPPFRGCCPFRPLLFRRALLTQPRNHAGRSDLLAESRRSCLPDRVQLVPQRRLRCGALCRDLLRRSLLPLVRHLRPGNELRGPQASLLRRRVRARLPTHGPPATRPGSQSGRASRARSAHTTAVSSSNEQEFMQ